MASTLRRASPAATLRVDFLFNERSGLWAARSPDCPALCVVDRTVTRVMERAPQVASLLAQAMGGGKAQYRWANASEPTGFRPLSRVLERVG